MVENLTNQQIFDKVYTYYQEGGKPGFGPVSMLGPTCEYFSKDGGHCAIGVLLKDKFTVEDVPDNTHISDLPGEVLDYLESLTNDKDFLESLQEAHDGPGPGITDTSREGVLERLEEFAADQDLKIPGKS